MDTNEINISINIKNGDIGQQIYFMYNIEELNNNQEIAPPDKFKNCEIKIKLNDDIINDYYSYYFIPEKEGEYNITINFKELIIDCSYMFYKCEHITKIDLTKFNSSKVKNMGSMFKSCKKLNSLNLQNFITDNVFNMEEAFSNCENLSKIDISSFNTKNVKFNV